MRARIPKQRKVSADSKNFIIELGKPMAQIDEKVQRQYEELIKENGEERRLDIIAYMQTEKFINLFSPCTPPIRKRISESVLKLGEKVVLEDLRKTVNNMQRDYKLTLETIVEKMKSGMFSAQLKTLVPASLGNIAEEAVDKFMQEKAEELEKKKAEEQAASLDSQDKSLVEPDEVQLEEDIQEKRVSNSSKEQLIDTRPEDDRKAGESTGMSIEEERFFEQVRSFTNGFNFLARDLLVHISETGRRNIGKFDKLDDYIRFTQIQEKVRQAMVLLKTDESSAIKAMLKESNGRLSKVDFNILNARKQELDKKRNSIGLQDKQEM